MTMKPGTMRMLAVLLPLILMASCNKAPDNTQQKSLSTQQILLGRQTMIRFDHIDIYADEGLLTTNTGQSIRPVDETIQIQTIEQNDFKAGISFVTTPESETVIVSRNGEQEFSGTAWDFDGYIPGEDGDYLIEITARYETESFTGHCSYRFIARYKTSVSFEITAARVRTGDAFVLIGRNLRSRDVTVTLDYSFVPHLTFDRAGNCMALIPVNHLRTTGEYTMQIQYSDGQKAIQYEVIEQEYSVQHLSVPESTYDNTVGNNDAQDEYYRVLVPLYESFDDGLYWKDQFLQPVEGEITTEYGAKRYVNDNPNPTRHSGIDIATALGTPVAASNTGKVLFSGFLKMTGNTVLIEHGMGLHTVYFHMDSLLCETGQVIDRGEWIGRVGMTGFATGPHLHFEIMIGFQSICPQYAFDGESGIYILQK